MLTLPWPRSFLNVLFAFCTFVSLASAEPKPSDSAVELEKMREEVRLLRLRVAELEKQVCELKATLQSPAPVMIQPRPLAQPGAAGQVRLPRTIQLPPIALPPYNDPLPWNYDTGLYVLPDRRDLILGPNDLKGEGNARQERGTTLIFPEERGDERGERSN